jgi:hypothetical protein
MSVESLALVGSGGNVHTQWAFEDGERQLSVRHPKTEEAWTLAEIRGAHWAVSPIFFSEE